MAFSKSHLYKPADQIAAGSAHAFGHAARIVVIRQLITLGPNCVQVIATDHPIHKESLSDHLKILRSYQLVEYEEKFPYTFYKVHEENVKRACGVLIEYCEGILSGMR